MLRHAAVRQAAAAGAWRPLPAGLHHSSTAPQQPEAAPLRMEEVAQAVKEVMGEPSPQLPATPKQQAATQAAQQAMRPLRFDDPQEAFKVLPSPAGLLACCGWQLHQVCLLAGCVLGFPQQQRVAIHRHSWRG
jgi:type II secretory pathway component PulM